MGSDLKVGYEALFKIKSGILRNYVCVKKDEQPLIQVGVRYFLLKKEQKKELVADVNELIITKHPNLLHYVDRFVDLSSGTLYILTRFCNGPSLRSIIDSCISTSSFLDEKFIWKILKQTGSALAAIPECRKNQLISVYVQPSQVFIDSEGNAQLAYIFKPEDNLMHSFHYTSPEDTSGVEFTSKTRTWFLGSLIYEICSLSFPSKTSMLQILNEKIRLPRIPSIYSDQLQSIIELMLTVDVELRPTIDIVLHFPSLVTLQRDIDHFSSLTESQNSEDSVCLKLSGFGYSRHYLETDLDTVLSTLCLSQTSNDSATQTSPKLGECDKCRIKENENDKEIVKDKLSAIHKREIKQKEKEEWLQELSYNLDKREKKVCLLEKMVKSKLHRAEVYLRQCKEKEVNDTSGTYVSEKSLQRISTAAKLDPMRYPNPFDNRTNRSICPGKENLPRNVIPNKRQSLHGIEVHPKHEHQAEVHKRLSWNDDCYLWLKNKRQSYHDRSKSAPKAKVKLRC